MPESVKVILQAGELWWWLLPLALLVVVLWTYRRTWPPVRPGYRLLLLGLRLLVVTLAGLMLFDPVLVLTRPGERRERVAVLVDRSASMLLPAGSDPETAVFESRLDRAVRLIESSPPDSLVTVFGFGARLEEIEAPRLLPESPDDRTDLNSALEALIRPGSPNWDRIYVLSDGAVNAGADPLRLAASLPPVESVIIGEPPTAPDIAISSLRLTRPAFEDEPLEIDVSLESVSGETRAGNVLVVDFLDGGRKAGELRLSVGSDGGRFLGERVELPAMREGRHFIRAVLRPSADEWTSLNNERLIAVDVVRARRKMLLVSNSPDWDFTFLKRALARERDWAVSTLLVLEGSEGRLIREQNPEGKFSSGTLPGSARLEELQLLALHGDLTAFGRDFLERVAARASQGGFALVLWPVSGFDTGSLPAGLTRLLPFAGGPVRPDARPAPDAPSRLWSDGIYDIIPGLGLSAGALPPVERAFRPLPLAREAQVLASIPGQASVPSDDPRGIPLLAVRVSSGARAATALGTGLWRWHMLTRDTGGGSDSAYERLWSMLGAWLVAGERRGGLTLTPEQGVFSRGQNVSFSGSAADGSPAAVRLVVTSDSLEADTVAVTELRADETDGSLAAALGSLPPGLYHYRAVQGDEETAPGAGGSFAVERFSHEMTRIFPDTSLLHGLSRATGGAVRSEQEIEGRIRAGLAVERSTHHLRLAGRLWPWFMLIALLATEWALRRRKSLA